MGCRRSRAGASICYHCKAQRRKPLAGVSGPMTTWYPGHLVRTPGDACDTNRRVGTSGAPTGMATLRGRVDVHPWNAQDTRAHSCHPAGMRRQEARKPKASLGYYVSHPDHLPILGAAHSRFNACIMCRCGSVPANKHRSHCTSVSPRVCNVLGCGDADTCTEVTRVRIPAPTGQLTAGTRHPIWPLQVHVGHTEKITTQTQVNLNTKIKAGHVGARL